jgi:hypothetical protein
MRDRFAEANRLQEGGGDWKRSGQSWPGAQQHTNVRGVELELGSHGPSNAVRFDLAWVVTHHQLTPSGVSGDSRHPV